MQAPLILISARIHQNHQIETAFHSRPRYAVGLSTQPSRTIPFNGISVFSRERKRDAINFTAVFHIKKFRPRTRCLSALGEYLFYFVSAFQALFAVKRIPFNQRSAPRGNSIDQYGFFSSEAESFVRPLARRRLRTRRPPRVFMRARNPNFRFRLTLLG